MKNVKFLDSSFKIERFWSALICMKSQRRSATCIYQLIISPHLTRDHLPDVSCSQALSQASPLLRNLLNDIKQLIHLRIRLINFRLLISQVIKFSRQFYSFRHISLLFQLSVDMRFIEERFGLVVISNMLLEFPRDDIVVRIFLTRRSRHIVHQEPIFSTRARLHKNDIRIVLFQSPIMFNLLVATFDHIHINQT